MVALISLSKQKYHAKFEGKSAHAANKILFYILDVNDLGISGSRDRRAAANLLLIRELEEGKRATFPWNLLIYGLLTPAQVLYYYIKTTGNVYINAKDNLPNTKLLGATDYSERGCFKVYQLFTPEFFQQCPIR